MSGGKWQSTKLSAFPENYERVLEQEMCFSVQAFYISGFDINILRTGDADLRF